MAIEVNEFQTQLTDELLDSLDREVRDTLIEYISNVPFIQNLISPNRERAKDRPRDSQGRIIVDLVKPHTLEDMDYFRPALMHFREHGVYTKLKPNSNKNSEFYRFLKQEVHRCRYGMVRPSDGEWVTGHLYFYLNYMPITVVRLDASKTFGTRLDDFPDMWEGIYWRYHYIEQARYGGLYNDFKGGQHGAEIACRGASKSYSVAAILAKLFLLGENDLNKSKVKANMFSYLKEYLNKDGTLDKFVNAINHCGDHTEFPSLRLKDSMSEMQWKSGFMDSENRPRGSQNEVLGLAIKDDPGKARGKRPHPYSEKVITYSGIKKWGDIKIGDTLIGDDGKPTNVIQIHEVGEQDIYKIELSDGRTVHSTLDHLWQVDILGEKVDKTTEELIDLMKSNYVYIRSCSPIESLCEKDVDVVEFIDSGGNILELSIYQRLQYFKIKYDDLAYSNYLWINDLDKKEVEIISRIARSLGWGCYSGSHSARINKCPSKSRIINIELVGREQAKCVTVDNDSHLYLIGDFVITHNSSFQAVEEFGFFPNYLDFYQTTLPNVQEGQAAAGQSYSIGTGGEENSDFTGALELIQSPSGYNIYGLPNFYDKGSNGSRKTIFFFPGYINRIGYYNKDGVSDVVGAMLSEIKYRVNLKYNSSDPMMLTRRKAETAFTLQDAIMRRSGSIFPSAELNDRINELDSNPSSYNDMYVGYLYIEDGEVKFKPDSDLQPIMEFPHKDNKKEGAVHILRMPEKDSSGKVPNGRYIAGSDVYDDDTSETLSLGSFYILDLFTDDLVFEYTGRPMFADDFYEICRRACLFYNAELNYENNKKGLFKYFSQHNSLYLLSDTLEFLADKEIIKPGTYGNKKKGVGNYGQVAPYGRRCIRDYLLKPVEMERQIEKADGSIEIEEVNIMKLHTIKYRALLQELSMWSEDLNTDRVDALAMLMLLREDRLRLAGDDGVKKSIRKDDATYLGNDDYFNRNYKNKHN